MTISGATYAVCALLAAIGLAGCGGDTGSGPRAPVVSLGCHQYCQDAGSPQGAGSPAPQIRIDTSGSVIPLAGGIVPVTLTCRASKPCRGGALLLSGPGNYSLRSRAQDCGPTEGCFGKSDLDLGAHTTSTIGVPISATGRALLAAHGPVQVVVMVEFPPDSFEQSPRPLTIGLSAHPPAGSVTVGPSPHAIAVSGATVWVADPVANTVTRVDAGTGNVIGSPIPAGERPDGLAAGAGSVWVADAGLFGRPGGVLRVDARTGEVVGQPLQLAHDSAVAIALDRGTVWVAGGSGSISRIDATSGREIGRPISIPGLLPRSIAAGDGGVWVGSEATLTRIDPRTARVVGSGSLGTGFYPVAVGQGSVWVARGTNLLSRLDASTGKLSGPPVIVGLNPAALTVGDGSVWVANSDSETVARVDAGTGEVIGKPISVGLDPEGIAVGDSGVWVANAGSGTISRIDPRTGKIGPVGAS